MDPVAGSSSNFLVPTFSGRDFKNWSKQMRHFLDSEGLWYVVDGYWKPESTVMLNDELMLEFQENLVNDRTALSLIHKSISLSISSTIFVKIFSASTTKDAWDFLHQKFKRNKCGRPPKDVPSAEHLRNAVEFCANRMEKVATPAPRSRSLRRPRSPEQIVRNQRRRKNVQSEEDSMKAILKSTSGKEYEVIFHGKKKLKGFGKGWHQFVADHNMEEGDQLNIQVTEHSSIRHDVIISLRKCTSSLQVQKECSRRRGNPTATARDNDDEDDDYNNVVKEEDNSNEYNINDVGIDGSNNNDDETELRSREAHHYTIIISKDDISNEDYDEDVEHDTIGDDVDIDGEDEDIERYVDDEDDEDTEGGDDVYSEKFEDEEYSDESEEF